MRRNVDLIEEVNSIRARQRSIESKFRILALAAILALLVLICVTQDGITFKTKNAPAGPLTSRLVLTKEVNPASIKTQNSYLVLEQASAAVGGTGQLRFVELSPGVNYVGFKAADTLGGDMMWTLPTADGGPGEVLSTNGSGVLSWTSAGGTMTIREVDLTPSIGSTTTLEFDQADGFVVSSPGAGTARVDIGTLPVARGGTGITASGAAGNYLRSDGSAWASSALQAGDIPSGSSYYVAKAPTALETSASSIAGFQYRFDNTNASASGGLEVRTGSGAFSGNPASTNIAISAHANNTTLNTVNMGVRAISDSAGTITNVGGRFVGVTGGTNNIGIQAVAGSPSLDAVSSALQAESDGSYYAIYAHQEGTGIGAYVRTEADTAIIGYYSSAISGNDVLRLTSDVNSANSTKASVTTDGILKLYDNDGTNWFGLKATGVTTANVTYVWPAAGPASSAFLKSDSSGNLSWDTSTYMLSTTDNWVNVSGDTMTGSLVIGDASGTDTLSFNGTSGQLTLPASLGTTNGNIRYNSAGTALEYYNGSTRTIVDTNQSQTLTNKTLGSGGASATWDGATIAVNRGGTGLTSYTIGQILYASAATTIAGLSDVATGSVLVSGGVGVAPSYSSNPTIGGNLTVNGNTALGDATSDTVTFTARVGSSVLPSSDALYALGATTNRWTNIYLSGDVLSSSGTVMYIKNQIASGQSAQFWTAASDATRSARVDNSNASGDAIWGINSAAAGAGIGGGVYGESAQNGAGSAGVWGKSTNSTGTGVVGVGNNLGGTVLSNGSGGAFTGTDYGAVAFATGTGGAAYYASFSGTNATGSGATLYNVSTSAGSNYGLFSSAQGSTGAGGQNIGVYGAATNGTYNAAGYFAGGGETVITYVTTGAAPVRSWNGSIATSSTWSTIFWKAVGGGNYYVNSSGSGDYSEFFRTADSSLAIGEVIALDPDLANGVRRARPRDAATLVGVVSQFGTRGNDGVEPVRRDDPEYVNVGMLGQVPVLVTLEGGQISPGDPLTVSPTIRGRATKAKGAGRIIGFAMTHFPYVAGERTSVDDSRADDAVHLKEDHVMCYLNAGWHDASTTAADDGKEPAQMEPCREVERRIMKEKLNKYESSEEFKRELEMKKQVPPRQVEQPVGKR